MRKQAGIAGMLVITLLVGCQGMPKTAERSLPQGVPANAELVGGGLADELTFQREGRLIAVDGKTGAAIHTYQVTPGEPIDMELDSLLAGLVMGRRGERGLATMSQIMGPQSKKGELDKSKLPTDPLTIKFYFVPTGEHAKSDEGQAAQN